MRSLYISFVLFLSFFSLLSYGQKKITSTQNQIKLAPLSMIDFVNPGFELSFERHFNEFFSTQVCYAFMTDLLSNDNHYSNYSGNRFGIEQKFFVRSVVSEKSYFSIDLLYTDVSYDKSWYFGKKSAGVDTFLYTYIDTIQIHRRTISLNLKAGRQYYVKRFILELAVGLGVKYRNTEHRDRIAPFDEMARRSLHPGVHYRAEREGKGFTFNLPLTFRVGYRF